MKRLSTTRRACANPQCSHTMPAGHLVCTECWHSVPARLRVQLNRAHRRRRGTPGHIAAVREVLAYLGAELSTQEAA